jgi:hypothetical protein
MSQFLTYNLVFIFRTCDSISGLKGSELFWRCKIMAGGRRCILVIEDDPETAEQLVDTLATNGYQVDLSIDGNDGLARGLRSVMPLPPASYDCS